MYYCHSFTKAAGIAWERNDLYALGDAEGGKKLVSNLTNELPSKQWCLENKLPFPPLQAFH